MDEEKILKRLKEDVINFDVDDIRKAAQLAVKAEIPPQRPINEALVGGLEEIGRRYQKDEYFLPDIIMAAEAMNEATTILFSEAKTSSDSDATVVLATVKGDIHDIGKNILSNFLSGTGIAVHDLGVDVTKAEIVETVERLRPQALGLSSMISTTSGEIKRVIKELEEKSLRKDLKVIIGGASTGRVFAKMAGVDAYAKDAVTGVKIIKKWIRH
ncbi:MAG: B12-binding domain-containing protein [Candidatus Hydrothermarchaeales archaeon]